MTEYTAIFPAAFALQNCYKLEIVTKYIYIVQEFKFYEL